MQMNPHLAPTLCSMEDSPCTKRYKVHLYFQCWASLRVCYIHQVELNQWHQIEQVNISASYIQDYEWAMGFLMNMIVFSVFTSPYLPLRLKYVSLHYIHKAVPDASCLKYVNFQGPCRCRWLAWGVYCGKLQCTVVAVEERFKSLS